VESIAWRTWKALRDEALNAISEDRRPENPGTDYLGKKGISQLLKGLGKLDPDARQQVSVSTKPRAGSGSHQHPQRKPGSGCPGCSWLPGQVM